MSDSRPRTDDDGQPLFRRRLAAEFLGTAALVTIVVGSGIAAQRLSPDDIGLQLLQNSIATALGLAVLIVVLSPVSGAHLNPAVSLTSWFLGRRARTGPSPATTAGYVVAQCLGGMSGAVVANIMFDVPTTFSGTERVMTGTMVGEIVATAGLVLVVFALLRSDQTSLVGPAVGAYIGAAYWFTSSTSFANPAVTVGRMFTDTFAGIAPASVPGFVLMQVIGAALGLAAVVVLYPSARPGTDAGAASESEALSGSM